MNSGLWLYYDIIIIKASLATTKIATKFYDPTYWNMIHSHVGKHYWNLRVIHNANYIHNNLIAVVAVIIITTPTFEKALAIHAGYVHGLASFPHLWKHGGQDMQVSSLCFWLVLDRLLYTPSQKSFLFDLISIIT